MLASAHRHSHGNDFRLLRDRRQQNGEKAHVTASYRRAKPELPLRREQKTVQVAQHSGGSTPDIAFMGAILVGHRYPVARP